MTTKTTLRCLAIRQPFAWAIAVGAKDIENRSWSTDHRGTFVIQASSTKTEVNRVAKKLGRKPAAEPRFATSALIGVADLVDVTLVNASLEKNPWAYGPYCFRVANARMFAEPIPAKGKLNLYHLDDALDAQVRERMPGARAVAPSAEDRAWLEAMHADPTVQLLSFFDYYVDFQKWEDVSRIGDAVVAVAPDQPAAWGYRGISKGMRDEPDPEGALRDVSKAVDLSKEEDAFWIMYRGLGHQELGHDAEAARDLARAKEMEPELFEEEKPSKKSRGSKPDGGEGEDA